MKPPSLSRRRFGWIAGASLLPASASAQNAAATVTANALTANDVIKRIQERVGIPWQAKTVDTFKAGDPNTPVQGICTTVMSTMDVLEKAALAGRNLIVTHEPTFWNHPDDTTAFVNSPIYRAKLDFIKANRLVVWRFHDHWHRRVPDGILTGVAATLGWTQYQKIDPNPGQTVYQGRQYFVLPPMSLSALASSMQSRLGSRTMRVVGNPQAQVSRVALEPGYAMLEAGVKALERDDVDVLAVGESREWETVEYAKDAVACGRNKALILIGHVASEDPGMEECARWLRTFVPEVPVQWMPAGEPFWTPA